MKKLISFIKNNFLILFLITSILHINIFTFFICNGKMTYDFFGKSYIVMFIISILLSIIVLIYKRYKKEYKPRLYDLLLLLLMIFSCISTVYAINPNTALYGLFGRNEGLFAILYYYNLLFIASFVNEKQKKAFIITFIISCLFQTIYAVFQITGQSFVNIVYNYDEIWATGTLPNPNFLASYMLLGTSCSIGLYVDSKDDIIKRILLIIIAFLSIGLFISNTMSCVVGLFIVLLYLLVYCIYSRKIKSFILIILIISGSFLILYETNNTTILKDTIKTSSEIVEMSKGNIDKNFGTNRIGIWIKSFEYVPKNLLHGCGIDNYPYLGEFGYIIVNRKVFDKAHNEYLQLLLTQGIFALITYLLLLGIIIIKGIKNNYKDKKVYLILPILGYIVQAFFNISVIEVAPIYYVLLGFLINRDK